MGIEIERKFLLANDEWRNIADTGTVMKQGYLAESETASVRVRIEGAAANINIKSAGINIKRNEYEYPIPLDDANEMLKNISATPLVEKTRYRVMYENKTWEIDVFAGLNDGLVVAEIELDNIDDEFSLPPWIGTEVSEDARYYNMNLARHPYKDW